MKKEDMYLDNVQSGYISGFYRIGIAFKLAVVARVTGVAFTLERLGVVVSISAAELTTGSTECSGLCSLTGSSCCDVTIVDENLVAVSVGKRSDASARSGTRHCVLTTVRARAGAAVSTVPQAWRPSRVATKRLNQTHMTI